MQTCLTASAASTFDCCCVFLSSLTSFWTWESVTKQTSGFEHSRRCVRGSRLRFLVLWNSFVMLANGWHTLVCSTLMGKQPEKFDAPHCQQLMSIHRYWYFRDFGVNVFMCVHVFDSVFTLRALGWWVLLYCREREAVGSAVANKSNQKARQRYMEIGYRWVFKVLGRWSCHIYIYIYMKKKKNPTENITGKISVTSEGWPLTLFFKHLKYHKFRERKFHLHCMLRKSSAISFFRCCQRSKRECQNIKL